MLDALNFKTIPNREPLIEAMRSCSQHHASSARLYEEDLAALKKNAPVVVANWKGDGHA